MRILTREGLPGVALEIVKKNYDSRGETRRGIARNLLIKIYRFEFKYTLIYGRAASS
jgi:hypothetical protein